MADGANSSPPWQRQTSDSPNSITNGTSSNSRSRTFRPSCQPLTHAFSSPTCRCFRGRPDVFPSDAGGVERHLGAVRGAPPPSAWSKTEVRTFDYVDRHVPMLNRMSEKRMRGYGAMGYALGARSGSGTSVDHARVVTRDDEEGGSR
jgi:hypothetical protein